MCKREGKRPTKLRCYLCGGAPVPGTMVHRAREKGIVLCEVYGSTESCPHVYVPPAYALGWNGKFSGRPFKGIEVRVVDEQGRDVPTGMQGEELSRGPNVFVGYLGNPEALSLIHISASRRCWKSCSSCTSASSPRKVT